jgi:hypothetical protein
MQQITVLLQNNIKTVMTSLSNMQRECKSIYDTYWKTMANTTVSGLSTDATPATVTSKLTKKNYIDAITLSENLNKFFQNTLVTTGDYLQTAVNAKYGNAVLGSALDVPTESIGDRLKQLCLDCIEIYRQSQNVLELYFDNEVGDIVAVLDSHRIIYGSEMTVSELSSAITLLQQFNNFMSNSAVTTGDYGATISVWSRLDEI